MDTSKRLDLEAATRKGLEGLGATPQEIAWVCEPGTTDEELARRVKTAVDARIQARLEEVGMRGDEVGAVIDRTGTPPPRDARIRAAAAGIASRRLAAPGALDTLLEAPAFLADLEARVTADAKTRRRNRVILGLGAVGVLVVGGLVTWAALRPSSCAKLLGSDADLSAAFGSPVHRAKIYDNKYFCQVDVQDAVTKKRLAFVTVESSSKWPGLDREVNSKDYLSVEPASFGDTSKLGIAPPPKDIPTDVSSLLDRRRNGSRDAMGDALAAMGPPGHMLVGRAGSQAICIVFYGAPEQARAVTKWLAPRADAVRSGRYR